MASSWLTTGPTIAAFEDALALAVGAADCVAVSSGTAALHAAYAVAGIGPGRDIVTSPLTFAATAYTALQLGAKVSFADVDDDYLSLNPEEADGVWTDATVAVVPVDYGGQPAALGPLRELADRRGALMIEDAAHSLGATYRDEPVGSIADLTTFSFHPVKTITSGEGGAVATRDGRWSAELRSFRNHGLVKDPGFLRYPDEGPWHQELQSMGLNYRLSDIQAALGLSQLRRLSSVTSRREELARRYDEMLADEEGIRLPKRRPDTSSSWHLYPIRVLGGERRRVFDKLRSANIGVQVHWLPVYRHPFFEDLGYPRGLCPIAERAYEELLSIPLYPSMTSAEQDRVIGELTKVLT